MAPHNGKFVAYYRVSTDKQGVSGLGLEAQQALVRQFLNGGRWSVIGEFTEIESGTRKKLKHRPMLAGALELARKQKATLVVAKLDRLARDVQFISTLLNSPVKVVCADMPEADKTWLHVMSAFAEREARLISERTSAALQALKARGKKLGSPRPEIGSAIGTARLIEKADQYAERVGPLVRDIQRRTGATTLRELAEALAARGITTPTGNDTWHASQVRNLLKRIK
jgi:DNA invertase Pin-like site-specific DNA recombinase